MKRCAVCGEIVEDSVTVCPVCKATKFVPIDDAAELKFACVHEVGVAKGLDEEVVAGLRANFRAIPKSPRRTSAMPLKRRSMLPSSRNCWARSSPIPPKRTWSCASPPRRAPARASSRSPSAPKNWAMTPSMTPCTRWQKTKPATALALQAF